MLCFALNVNADFRDFENIISWGIRGKAVAALKHELGGLKLMKLKDN